MVACSLVVDRERFEDGDAASTVTDVSGSDTQASASSASTSGPGGGGGQGGAPGNCLDAAFHVSFDAAPDPLLGVLEKHGNGDGLLTTDDARIGPNAWKLTLEAAEAESSLRNVSVHRSDEVWFAFSQRFDTPPPAPSIDLFWVGCGAAEPVYVKRMFAMSFDSTLVSQPFGAKMTGSFDPSPVPSLDELGSVVWVPGYHDWIAHMRFSHDDTEGVIELYHAHENGYEKVYSYAGADMDADCIDSQLYVYLGALSYAWTSSFEMFEDELTLLEVHAAPYAEKDALYTLTPGNCTFPGP